MSCRSYDNFLQKEEYHHKCKGNLIEGNKDLHIMVNPDNTNAQIFFTKNELLKHCLLCKHKEICKKEKENLLKILGEE